MLDEDRDAMRRLKADLVKLAHLPDEELKRDLDPASCMKYYNIVYRAATQNSSKGLEYSGLDIGEVLYMDYHEIFTSFLRRFRDLGTLDEMDLFLKILDQWKRYKLLMKWSIWTFGYLSRYYIVNHSKPTLEQVALGIFFERIFKLHIDILSRVTQNFLINDTPEHSTNQSLINSAVDLFSSLKVYDAGQIYCEDFLKPYIQRITDKYKNLFQTLCKTMSGIDFLRKVHESLGSERRRCHQYFCTVEEEMILSSIESIVIDFPRLRNQLIFSDNGFFHALRTRNEHALRQYYELFSRAQSGIELLCSSVREEIESEGKDLSQLFQVNEMTVSLVKYIKSIIELQETFQHLAVNCFSSHSAVARAVQEGLTRIFNGRVQVTNHLTEQPRYFLFCELLAKYIDILLQNDNVFVRDEHESIMTVLMFLNEKDCFLLSLKEHLLERIISPAKKLNELNEWNFIKQIKQRWGSSSTAHLEGMLRDLHASKRFDALAALRSLGKTSTFDVSVLFARKGIWPDRLSIQDTLIVPDFIQSILNLLQDAYLKAGKEHRLIWSHQASRAEVKARYKQKTHTFSVSGIQALILLSFNRMPVQSFDGIMTANGISRNQLYASLLPLTKGKVLLSSSRLKQFDSESEKLTANDNYTNLESEVVFLPTLTWTNILTSEQTVLETSNDRKLAVDTCLVKILKKCCAIDHEDLLFQCQNHLAPRFSTDVRLIKQRVDELIEKGYIERSQSDHSKYRYIP